MRSCCGRWCRQCSGDPSKLGSSVAILPLLFLIESCPPHPNLKHVFNSLRGARILLFFNTFEDFSKCLSAAHVIDCEGVSATKTLEPSIPLVSSPTSSELPIDWPSFSSPHLSSSFEIHLRAIRLAFPQFQQRIQGEEGRGSRRESQRQRGFGGVSTQRHHETKE